MHVNVKDLCRHQKAKLTKKRVKVRVNRTEGHCITLISGSKDRWTEWSRKSFKDDAGSGLSPVGSHTFQEEPTQE